MSDQEATDSPPTQESEQATWLGSAWEHVEGIGRVVAFATVILYVIGLVVTNVYLFGLGASDFTVLRTRFILTGALVVTIIFLATIALIVPLVFVVWSVIKVFEAKRTGKWTNLDWMQTTLPLLVFFYFIGIWVTVTQSGLGWKSPMLANIDPPSNNAVLLLVSFSTISALGLMIHILRKRRDGESNFPAAIILGASYLVATLWVMFLAIDPIAATVYPAVPEQFGGGKPKQVEIVLSDDGIARAAALGFGQPVDGSIRFLSN